MVKRDPIQGVVDGRLLTIRLRSEEDECRLYIINAWHDVPGLYLAEFEFKCKSRGMETCLHTRGAALNARETGIYQSNIVPAISGSMYAISRLRINGIEE